MAAPSNVVKNGETVLFDQLSHAVGDLATKQQVDSLRGEVSALRRSTQTDLSMVHEQNEKLRAQLQEQNKRMRALCEHVLELVALKNRFFLLRGADVHIRNYQGETAVDVCGAERSNAQLACLVNDQLKKATRDHRKGERLVHPDIAFGRENFPIPLVNAVDNAGLPTAFHYICKSVETSKTDMLRDMRHIEIHCDCTDLCATSDCKCVRRMGGQCFYAPDGSLIPEFSFNDLIPIFECNVACRCWSHCRNRVVQAGMTVQLQVFRTPRKGWGVQVLEDVPRGTYICEYVGELLADYDADRREDDSYLFDLDIKGSTPFCIDAFKYGNVSRFINHSCRPNIVPVRVFIDHQDLRYPLICFFAVRPIKKFEELGFDYGEKFWIIKYKNFTCDCREQSCKYSAERIDDFLSDFSSRHPNFFSSPTATTASA